MRAIPVVLVALLLGSLLAALRAADEPPIDPERGKQLMHKFQAGEKLTPEEQAYLDRVRQEIRKRAGQKGTAPQGAGPKAARNREPIPRDPNINKPEMLRTLVPLSELTGSYKGEDGGLYGGGHNEPPAAHLAAARVESGKIRPLDAQGRPADDGKIVLLSAGLSHTTMEFSEFKKAADADPQKSPKVVVVDGAQGGKPAVTWALSGAQFLPKEEVQRLQKEVEAEKGFIPQSNRVNEWDVADGRLASAGVTPQQVQVLWLKEAIPMPSLMGEFPAHARAMAADITSMLIVAKKRYPNLRIVYLSSRSFGGYAHDGKNPEPYAYENGFSVRWVIQSQIAGEPRLNYDSARGPVTAPLLLWGPYLWANGTTPRKSDGLVWQESDFGERDGMHPSPSGKQKVVQMLLNFFKTDPLTRAWFVKPSLAAEAEQPIDLARVRQIMTKRQQNQLLTPEETAYLNRAFEMRRRQQGGQPGPAPRGAQAAPSGPATIAPVAKTLVPLTELTGTYKGEDGGLYGGGRNEPPAAHRAAYLKESEKIRPLDADGQPAADGKIGLVTIGFSNTNLESIEFKSTADADPQKSPQVVVVNGAIGLRAAVTWAWDGADVLPKAEQERLDKEMDTLKMPKADRNAAFYARFHGSEQGTSPPMPKSNREGRPAAGEKDTWLTLDARLKAAGLAPKQVQALWMKHVEAGPRPLGEFPAHARALQADMEDILIIAKKRFPNLRVAYLSSRTFAGWNENFGGSPEPYAYECAFAVRWLIQSQIAGEPRLNYDPARGEVNAPLVIWGPYLWTRGDRPRKLDGMIWTIDDVVTRDRIHPSDSGCKKVTALLMNLLKTDVGARRWFLAPNAGEVVPLKVDSPAPLPGKG